MPLVCLQLNTVSNCDCATKGLFDYDSSFWKRSSNLDEPIDIIRLEDILNTARQSGKVKEEEVNDMLTSKLFEGLRPELKNVGRYKRDTINEYDKLLKSLRMLELISQLEDIQEQQQSNVRHIKHYRSKQNKQRINVIHDETILYRPTTKARLCNEHTDDRICWRCNQQGQISVNCTVRLDHSQNMRRAINFQQIYDTERALTNVQPKGLLGLANEVEITNIREASIKAICSVQQNTPYSESLAMSSQVIDGWPNFNNMTKINIREEQQNDDIIRFWIMAVNRKEKPKEESQERPQPTPKPIPKPRTKATRRKRKKETEETKVNITHDVDKESDEDSLVCIMRQPAADVIESDNDIPLDADTESVDDTFAVLEETGDHKVLIEEQQENQELQPDDFEENDDSNDDQDDVDNDEAHGEPNRHSDGLQQETTRRSTRHKTSTTLTKYKDFHVPSILKGGQQTDWMIRADYLRSAISSGAFENVENNVSNAFLS
ncbi:unnamed protein product [Mytilus coruscus]|uniref:CCHC-type domain-containing protein n=1 Tax=Mytilus coruscus TaxID=42192 RepID=A0A6J8CPD4_MYTCO|nr:unnamed protein product [Mytilus coruscus]